MIMKRIIHLGDLATYVNGYAFKPCDWTAKGKPIIRIQNLTDSGKEYNHYEGNVQDKYLVQKGDILISWSASIGVYEWEGEDAWLNQHIFKVVFDKEDVDKCYFKYAVGYVLAMSMQYAHGATMKHLTKGVFDGLQIPLYEKEKQIEIADRIGQIDDAIEECNILLSEFGALVKSRFVEMFGDPVTNPMGWKTASIRDTSELISDGPFGSNLKSSHYVADGIRVIRLGNIGTGKFLDYDKAYISEEHYETLKKYTCRAGEIVIGTLGEPNLRACLIPDYIAVSVNKSDCVHFIPKSDMLNNTYACAYLNTDGALQLAQGSLHGQTRSRIAMGQVAALPIMLPPLALQNQFADFVALADKSKLTIQKSLENLTELRDSLMQEYFG